MHNRAGLFSENHVKESFMRIDCQLAYFCSLLLPWTCLNFDSDILSMLVELRNRLINVLRVFLGRSNCELLTRFGMPRNTVTTPPTILAQNGDWNALSVG